MVPSRTASPGFDAPAVASSNKPPSSAPEHHQPQGENSYAVHLSNATNAFDELMLEMPDRTEEDGEGEALAWLSRSVYEILGRLSEATQSGIRDQLKAQEKVFTLKLETARTAGRSALLNQAAEMEGTFHRKMEAQANALKAGEGTELKEANERIEELNLEVGKLKLKLSGVEEAFAMCQKLLRASEAKASQLEEEHANELDVLEKERKGFAGLETQVQACEALLEEAVSALELKRSDNERLEERLKAFIEQTRDRGEQLEEARTKLDEVVEMLEASNEENVELQRQLKAFDGAADIVRERDSLREEVEQLGHGLEEALAQVRANEEKVPMLQAALARMGDTQKQLKTELEETKEALRRASAVTIPDTGELEKAQQRISLLEEEMAAWNRKLDASFAAWGLGEARIKEWSGGEMSRVGLLFKHCEEVKKAKDVVKAKAVHLEKEHKATLEELERTRKMMEGDTSVYWQREAKASLDEVRECARHFSEAIGHGLVEGSLEEATPTELGVAMRTEVSRLVSQHKAKEARLRGKVAELEASAMEMSGELMQATGKMSELQLKYLESMEAGVILVKEEQERARKERSRLVQASLDSLHQMRIHLINVMTGLRASTSSSTREKFAWDRWEKRWGLQSAEGRLDELVVTMKLPPPSGGQKKPSPRNRRKSAVASATGGPGRASGSPRTTRPMTVRGGLGEYETHAATQLPSLHDLRSATAALPGNLSRSLHATAGRTSQLANTTPAIQSVL